MIWTESNELVEELEERMREFIRLSREILCREVKVTIGVFWWSREISATNSCSCVQDVVLGSDTYLDRLLKPAGS